VIEGVIMLPRVLWILIAALSVAADFPDIEPNVIPANDPRAKDLPRMMMMDARRRMQEANLRESRAFAQVTGREQWESYRDERIANLKKSLGLLPEPPKNMRIRVTKKLEGDGFVIHNLLYESRPGLWVSANLYLPAKPGDRMPGLLISHSHHTAKAHGELQDMGMTWARAGCAVLVPDHLGHGERRQHDFHTEKDFDQPFRVGRQDYYFRYNSNLQLSAVGESLMGWMVWDLMRGIDVLLKQSGIDQERIILLGAVAGGGDPAGVTAALDKRVTCLVPFNFGGWQPESRGLENPDRDYEWFGEGYWESTRGLRGGAAGGFAHYVIVGSIAPRKLIYAHEFAWNEKLDPAWPRMKKIYGFYGAEDALRVAHGSGTVRESGPGNTHCTHIGAVHRKMIYPALRDWFGMPIPEEYSKRRPSEDLLCWTEELRDELVPKKMHDLVREIAGERLDLDADMNQWLEQWSKLLGNIEPAKDPKIEVLRAKDFDDIRSIWFNLDTEPGIILPGILLTPLNAKGKLPVVVMVAQGGKAGFLKERKDSIAAFLKAGIAVCLFDVRGTGETQSGTSADRASTRTTVSQTNLILGQPVLGSQFRDLRSLLKWLRGREEFAKSRMIVWGDSFAKVNPESRRIGMPAELEDHAIAEPVGAHLVELAFAFREVSMAYSDGGFSSYQSLYHNPYFAIPHDAIVPGPMPLRDSRVKPNFAWSQDYLVGQGYVDAHNRRQATPAKGAVERAIRYLLP
jgi:cephalosporin-C deacetylase-like acetyl esterase